MLHWHFLSSAFMIRLVSACCMKELFSEALLSPPMSRLQTIKSTETLVRTRSVVDLGELFRGRYLLVLLLDC